MIVSLIILSLIIIGGVILFFILVNRNIKLKRRKLRSRYKESILINLMFIGGKSRKEAEEITERIMKVYDGFDGDLIIERKK